MEGSAVHSVILVWSRSRCETAASKPGLGWSFQRAAGFSGAQRGFSNVTMVYTSRTALKIFPRVAHGQKSVP